jgi:hypothetical protein
MTILAPRRPVIVCLAIAAAAAAERSAAGQAPCPTGKPVTLVRGIGPVLGQSPLWVTPGRFPIKWDGPNHPVQLLWVIDANARGQILVTGKHRDTRALLRFTKFGDTLGERQARFALDPLGYKPKQATAADLQRYGFDLIYAWFPEAGCYEIQGRVGRQQATIYLEIGKPSGP